MVLSNGYASALGIIKEMEMSDKIVVLGEDVKCGGIFGQYRPLVDKFADRLIDTPISEIAITSGGIGMALVGMRPIIDLRAVDFALCAMDEIVNQAAKHRYMYGGQTRLPIVLRMAAGVWDDSASQHSNSLESWFTHIPGLSVVYVSNPQSAYSLMRAALQANDPVVFIEGKMGWKKTGEVDESVSMELGKGRKILHGEELTIVSWGAQVEACEKAIIESGKSVDLIDLQSLWPWDKEMVLSSCMKTKNLLVVHEAIQVGGFGAEIAATVAEHVGCRVRRLGAPRIPVGYARSLEGEARVSVEQIVKSISS